MAQQLKDQELAFIEKEKAAADTLKKAQQELEEMQVKEQSQAFVADMENKTNEIVIARKEKSSHDVGLLDTRVSELETKLSKEIFEKEEVIAKNKKLEATVKSLTARSETMVDANVIQ